MEIIQLKAADFEEAIDFLNLVFSSAWRPHDFVNMLPAVYRPTDLHMGCNYAVRDGGRIRAIVGAFPITLAVGATELRLSGIGGVSTHPSCRRQGYMQALMERAVRDMRAQGCHASYLGGRRQRYARFGYECAGTALVFTVGKANFESLPRGPTPLRLEPLQAGEAEPLAAAQALHDRQPLHARRRAEDFHLLCRAWHNKPYAALDGAGRIAGYLVATGAGDTLVELVAGNDDDAVAMVREWTQTRGEAMLSVEAPALPGGWGQRLTERAESVAIRHSGNWQIFDWARVIGAFLQLRHSLAPLADGRVVVGVAGGGAFRLEVAGERAVCAPTSDPPDVQTDAARLTRLLFGPLPPHLVMPLPSAGRLLSAWCPLPLHLPRQDTV